MAGGERERERNKGRKEKKAEGDADESVSPRTKKEKKKKEGTWRLRHPRRRISSEDSRLFPDRQDLDSCIPHRASPNTNNRDIVFACAVFFGR